MSLPRVLICKCCQTRAKRGLQRGFFFLGSGWLVVVQASSVGLVLSVARV